MLWKKLYLNNLNSNIEIHKYSLYLLKVLILLHLNSNIEIHKYNISNFSNATSNLFKF